MLGRPDSGTRIDSVRLGAASSSMPPARTCDSISGSPPSWLLGKTVTFSRPRDCAPIARAASISRTVRGWVSGVLTPSLKSNSAAALAGLPRMVVAQAAEAAPSTPLRVIFIFVSSRRFIAPSSFGRTAAVRKSGRETRLAAVSPARHLLDSGRETILGNPRNHPETNAGVYVCANKAAAKDAWRLR